MLVFAFGKTVHWQGRLNAKKTAKPKLTPAFAIKIVKFTFALKFVIRLLISWKKNQKLCLWSLTYFNGSQEITVITILNFNNTYL